MSNSFEIRYHRLTATAVRGFLIKRLTRVDALTKVQYTELICDVGEFNRRHPRMTIPRGPRSKGSARRKKKAE